MELGPGERLVLHALFVLGKYPALVAATAYILNHYAGWAIPTWVVCAVAIITVPLVISLAIAIRCWIVYRAAERQGAVLAPRWRGRWIGNLDVLRDLLNSFRTGYPGESAHAVLARGCASLRVSCVVYRGRIAGKVH